MQQTASLIVDIKSVRCSQCKMLIRDVTVSHCPHCKCLFDRVASNHVGLAMRVQKERDAKQEPTAETKPPSA
jgi:phage FluMu protein Com